jgi:aminopeptidase N
VTGRSNLTLEEARRRAELVVDLRYRVELDLTDPSDFRSRTVLRFACREPGARTFVDLTAPHLVRAELNGEPLPEGAFDGHRLHLPRLQRENELLVEARCAYHRTELGMHRFVDPVDGGVYLHTDFEPFDAHRVFACFDQPDLKGVFEFAVLAEPDWEVVSNTRPVGPPAEAGGRALWRFRPTPPLPTYVTCVCAGPWHAVRDRHRDVELGLFCRRSLAEFLDPEELFEVTRQGFDFFERAFGVPYPFGDKYDQVFVPESNTWAMENAACVTFNDVYIFRSRVTDAARERRAETVLHEMAHMWFGDLVTMRWWNDLWLNESFASYMAVLAQAEATRWKEAWTTFADTEKAWAYRQDQLPTTHPVVADIPDVESIHLNFDGITYAKGASVLKQLVHWVGKDRFLEGMKRYHQRHRFGNATLHDFLAVLEEVSGRDLHRWSKEWLETAGVNTLRPEVRTERRDGSEVIASLAVLQEAPEDWPTLRSHRLAVGLYYADGERLRLRRRVELDVVGARTDVPDLAGEPVPDLLLLNDADLTYARVRLDERSLATVVDRLGDLQDSLARALCWSACWDMVRSAELPARRYLRLVLTHAGREPKIGTVQTLLAQAASAVYLYGDPGNRDVAARALAEACLEELRRAEPGSDHQLAWARAFISNARTEEQLRLVADLLHGRASFEGLAVDTELRWHIVRSLAAAGVAGEDVIAAEQERDPTDRGARHAAAARAARPTPEAKAEAWRLAVEEVGQPLAMTEAVMGGFQQFDQEQLLRPFVERYFEALPFVWERRELPEALSIAGALYPHHVVEERTVALTEAYLARPDVPAPIRRLLLEGKDGVERALRARAVDAGA